MSDPRSSDASGAPRAWTAALAVVAVASLPFVTLFAGNVGEELDEAHLLLWWAVTLAVAGVALAGVLRAPARVGRWGAAVLVVVLYLLFNLPGAVALRDALGWEIADVAAWWFLAGVVLAVSIPLLRFSAMQSFVFLLAPLLLLSPVVGWITETVSGSDETTDRQPTTGMQLEHTPDVWYFVLDGMASVDFTRERTGHDGRDFVAHLTERGFTVAGRAESNYPLTILSVGSALDLEYVYDGFEEPRGAPFFERLQGHSRTVDIFLDNGYAYAHTFPGLWRGSRCSGREDFCFGANGPLNDTEVALADLTPLGALLDNESGPAIAQANDPAFVVRQVLDAGLAAPAFHFIHLLSPHPPYLRGADCSIRDVEMRLAAWGDGPEYGEAVACLNQQLSQAVDLILAAQDDPLIIIQGDHGPRFGVDRSVEGGVTYAEDMFFSIFNAVRLPAPCADIEVPADLSPVNTFRLAFACLRDEQPDLLPNERYPIHRP